MVACRYAILRFLPYVETGEFANVGVVLMSTTGRFFGFRLLKTRIARVTHFFDLHDHKPLRDGLRMMREELERIEIQLKQYGTDRRLKNVDGGALEAMFAELTRPREVMFRFDAPRALLTARPATALEELFERHVAPDFDTKKDREAALEGEFRKLFVEYNLVERYKPEHVGDEQFNVRFPFVAHTNGNVRIIKPLHLTHTEPTKAIDHGLQWAGRVARLKKHNLLQGQILFALQTLPRRDAHQRAALEVQEMLRDAGAIVLEHTAREQIVQFARAA